MAVPRLRQPSSALASGTQLSDNVVFTPEAISLYLNPSRSNSHSGRAMANTHRLASGAAGDAHHRHSRCRRVITIVVIPEIDVPHILHYNFRPRPRVSGPHSGSGRPVYRGGALCWRKRAADGSSGRSAGACWCRGGPEPRCRRSHGYGGGGGVWRDVGLRVTPNRPAGQSPVNNFRFLVGGLFLAAAKRCRLKTTNKIAGRNRSKQSRVVLK